jgi:hypothetical protein
MTARSYPHPPIRTEKKTEIGPDLIAGAICGEIAGLVMAVVMMAVFVLFLEQGPLFPVQVIGSLVFGDDAVRGTHGGAIVAGLLLHQLGPSLVWGLVFGTLAWLLNVRHGFALVTLGLIIGIASQLLDVELLVPIAFRALHGHDIWAENVPPFWSWAAHIVYGLTLTIYPKIYKGNAS